MNPHHNEAILQGWPENEPVAHVNAWHGEKLAYAEHYRKLDGGYDHNAERDRQRSTYGISDYDIGNEERYKR